MRRRRTVHAASAAAAPLATLAVLLAAVAGPAAASDVDDPGDLPPPSAEALARSVTVFDPADSVITFDVPGSVEDLSEERKEAGRTVVTINSDVLFRFGSAELTPEAVQEITQVAGRMPRGSPVAVDGYTDAIGAPAANLTLSRTRAAAVAARIRATRPDVKVTVSGRGEANPVAPNRIGGKDNPEGRAKNRRVTIGFAS